MRSIPYGEETKECGGGRTWAAGGIEGREGPGAKTDGGTTEGKRTESGGRPVGDQKGQ